MIDDLQVCDLELYTFEDIDKIADMREGQIAVCKNYSYEMFSYLCSAMIVNKNYTFAIDEVIASSNGNSYLNVEMNMPAAYSISDAYPNPFNPTTALDIALDTDANVSVKVFNIMGQLVDVITEGNLSAGTHAVAWDASQVASGVYFINTEIGSDLNVQKVMLVK